MFLLQISGSESFTRWLAPGSELGASWSEGSEPNVILGFRVPTTIGLRKPPDGSPCSQLTPLAPRASLGPWSLWGARGYGQGGSKLKLARLPPSSLPSLQLASSSLQPPSSLPALSSLPACSPHSSSLPALSSLPVRSSSLPAFSSLPACSSSLQLAPLAPARSQLSPASQLAPARSQLSPTSQLTPARSPCSSSLPALSNLPALSSLPACSSSLQLAPARSQMPMNSLVCIGVPTTSGGQRARGQGGSKLKLAPLTPRSLPSIPSCSCHSPHSQLTGPHSQMPMKRLVCIWVPTTSWGQGARGQGGRNLNLAPITPLTTSLLDLAPNVQ